MIKIIEKLFNKWDIWVCKCIWYDINDFEGRPKPKMEKTLKWFVGIVVVLMVVLPIILSWATLGKRP